MTTERDGRARGDLPISAYGLIGDCHTAALVSDDGSIDWFCPGRFDAPALFCRLLDAGRGGYFRLGPSGPYAVTRRYRGPTSVLETTFQTNSGRLRLTDCMPVVPRGSRPRQPGGGRLLRLVEALGGQPELELCFRPTFDYARADGRLRVVPGSGAVAECGSSRLVLAAPGLELTAEDGTLRGRWSPRAGQRCWLALTALDDERQVDAALAVDRADELGRTLDYWQEWAGRCSYRGPYRDQVLRSALTLRLLTYDPSGALVAAPTTSLPESIGGVRNWDYRYTWLRDASLILYALLTVGYFKDAADFFQWLERTQQGRDDQVPQIMYRVDGDTKLDEEILDHLAGYRGSRPVRIGNAAAHQQQLDIFGDVLGAAALYYLQATPHQRDPHVDRSDGGPTEHVWSMLCRLVEAAADQWQRPGRGIWEVRGEPREFLYGRLRCWVALDRGIALAERFRLDAPLDRWRTTRHQIRQAILTQGFNRQVGAFTQAFGSAELDASVLAIPRLGLLPPTDPRVRSTVRQIQRQLSRDGLVYRYRTADGLPGDEATFAMCTFWLIDALALGGRLDEAHELFQRACGYANDLGLLAEEIDPANGELLGNFPQGFSHMALIGSAVNLAKAAKHGPEEEAESEASRAGRAGQAASEG